MNQEERLLHAAAEEPADDAPRLVLADWLEEQGDADRATFIRAGVELARMDEADPRHPELLARYRRAARFLAAPARPWVDHVPNARVAFSRGLISRAILDAREYLKQPPDSWGKVPVTELALWGYEGRSGPALAERPELARLRLLGLMNYWWMEDLLPLLGGCAHLAGLRELCLEHVGMQAEEWEDYQAEARTLAESLSLPALEGLSWQGGDVLSWPVLVPAFPPLKRLMLESHSDPELDEEADSWGWLVPSHHWKTLRQVALWHDINTLSYSTVYQTDPLPSFRRSFRACHQAEDFRIARDDLAALAACRSWGALHTLRLGHCALTDDLAPLASCPRAAQLCRLLLDHPDGPEPVMGQPQPGVLASGPYLRNLRHLRIGGYGLTEGDVDGLAAGPYRENLLRLELADGDPVSAARFGELVRRPWPELRFLRLCVAEAEALAPLLTTRNLPNLCSLALTTWRDLPEQVLHDLAAAPGLPHLSLVTVRSAEWVLGRGQAWQVHPEIDLAERDIFEDGAYRG